MSSLRQFPLVSVRSRFTTVPGQKNAFVINMVPHGPSGPSIWAYTENTVLFLLYAISVKVLEKGVFSGTGGTSLILLMFFAAEVGQ